MTRQLARRSMAGVLLTASCALCWIGWFGWDSRYDIDSRIGAVSGPYEPWQVVGCVLCLMVVITVAVRWLRLRAVALLCAGSVTTAFAVSAARTDDQGLWPVAVPSVFIATAWGTVVVAALARGHWSRRASRRQHLAPRCRRSPG